MDIVNFKSDRVEGRKQLFIKIIETFKFQKPLSIHQFGSGTKGFKDEFSDIDIWVTFKDEDIKKALLNLSQTFKDIAPVVVRHYSKSWSPVGGSANSIIHDTEFGLFVVDYYISKASETVIKKDSKILYGDDSLERGEWKLNSHVNKKVRDSHSLRSDTDLLVDLIFISFKGIVRKWEDDSFIKILKGVYKKFKERYKVNLKNRHISLSFKSNYRLLSDLYKISNKRQKKAINKIRKYGRQIEELYY